MKKNILLTISLASILFTVGCDDDFLETKPIAADTTESYYTSLENLNSSVTSAYGMQNMMLVDVYYFLIGSICDDYEAGGDNVNDFPALTDVDLLRHTANSFADNMLGKLWNYPYEGIRMCNTVLAYTDKVRQAELAGGAKAEDVDKTIASYVAQVKFLRANYHFMLMQVWGGVPYNTTLIDPEKATSTPRNTIAECLHLAEADLEDAIESGALPVKSATQPGRVSLGAAQALLSKVYLYEASYAENYPNDSRFTGCTNTYDKALQYAEEVINSGEYALFGADAPNAVYADSKWLGQPGSGGNTNGPNSYRYLFSVKGDNSCEGVYELQNLNDGAGWVYTRGSYWPCYSMCRYYYTDASKSGADQLRGWSFALPTPYLFAAFANADERETGLNSKKLDTSKMEYQLDPRFFVTVGVDGDYGQVANGNKNEWLMMALGTQGQNTPTGTIGRKYEIPVDDYKMSGDTYGEGPMNIRMIRYAEVLLFGAEAAYKTGNTTKALDYVNQVRKRARECGTTGYPEELTAISFEDIMHERRLELALETSTRYFDLTRWNKGKQFINGIYHSTSGIPLQYEEGKHEFMPLPAPEVSRDAALVQYAGWQ